MILSTQTQWDFIYKLVNMQSQHSYFYKMKQISITCNQYNIFMKIGIILASRFLSRLLMLTGSWRLHSLWE